MSPNWFIAFPMQVEGLHLPYPPKRVRVFDPADLHLTLGFLGSIPESDAREAWGKIEGFGSLRAVTGSFGRLRPLGHPKKPSALCAMVAEGGDAFTEMIGEAREPLLAAAGAPPDDRPPLPHVTIARVQRRAKAAERREALRWAEAVELGGVEYTATSIALYTWSADRQERLFRIVEEHTL